MPLRPPKSPAGILTCARTAQGAPPGHGSVKEGEKVYMDKCAACHGEFGESAGRWPALAQGKGTLASHDPVKTVGSYFPYLSSVFDYIRRAMPFGDAQSLSNDELYAVTAYVLNLNDIVDDKFVLSKETWAQVKMPNANGFYDDDRDKAEKAFWNKNPCMTDCRPPVKITEPCAGDRRDAGRQGQEGRGGVTRQSGTGPRAGPGMTRIDISPMTSGHHFAGTLHGQAQSFRRRPRL